jgi:ATP-dependent Zn protease
MSWWDHIKWLMLLAIIWLLLVFSLMGDDPLVGFVDAVRIEAHLALWVFILAGLEFLHQLHFVVSERSARYHQFWLHKVWGRTERFKNRHFSAWAQFRFWRLVRWLIAVAVLSIIVGKIIHVQPALALLKVPAILWHALPFVLQMVFLLFFAVAQFALLFWFMSRGGVNVLMADEVKTRFSDVWGQDQVLERVKENMVFLENPELIEERGGHVPGGILLWGPPGTGKTLIAEAVAGETGRPYVFVEPGALTSNMFFGVGILKVKGLFRKLRKLSMRYGGVILFIDEADSLGNRGGAVAAQALPAPSYTAGCHGFTYMSPDAQMLLARDAVSPEGFGVGEQQRPQILGGLAGGRGGGSGGFDGSLQALLTEMSGLTKPRGFFNKQVRKLLGMRPKPPPKYRILIMMATNMKDSLDAAFLRPGRIDRIYKVGYPSKAGRRQTYVGYLNKVSHDMTDEQIDRLAEITPYYTGAMIKDIVNEALILAIKDGREAITWPDVTRAKLLKDVGLPDDVEYIVRERHAVAVHEACHAVVAYREIKDMRIERATIEKGDETLGYVASIKPEDQFTRWRKDYEADIMSSLASLAGERMFFDNDNSSGVMGDLRAATTVASYMEGYFGMGSTISSLPASTQMQVGAPGGSGRGQAQREDASEQARRALADRVEDNLTRLLERAERVLGENRRFILAVAHALETHKTITGEDITAIMEYQQGPIVDGGIYASDDFAAELEQYHELAARAHREHDDKPQIQLPVAPEPVLASVAAGPYALNAAYGPETAYDTATGAHGGFASGGVPGAGVPNGGITYGNIPNGGTASGNGLRTGSYGDIFEDTRDDLVIEDTRDDIITQGPDDDGFYEPPSYGPPEGPSSNGHPDGQS